jgi:hypothetical protein
VTEGRIDPCTPKFKRLSRNMWPEGPEGELRVRDLADLVEARVARRVARVARVAEHGRSANGSIASPHRLGLVRPTKRCSPARRSLDRCNSGLDGAAVSRTRRSNRKRRYR